MPAALRLPLPALCALALTAHCGDDTTGRSPVAFAVEARGVRAEATTSLGWAVRIERATLRVSTLRWFEGDPIARLRPWERLLGVRLAHAHPGHYVPGEALADITTPVVVDLTRPAATSLGVARGVSGTARSARIGLHPAPADDPALPGATLALQGRATRDGVTVRFATTRRVDQEIVGVPAPGELTAAGSPWALLVDLAALVDRVDFSALPAPAAPGDITPLPDDGQGVNALDRALRATSSYRVLPREENP